MNHYMWSLWIFIVLVGIVCLLSHSWAKLKAKELETLIEIKDKNIRQDIGFAMGAINKRVSTLEDDVGALFKIVGYQKEETDDGKRNS